MKISYIKRNELDWHGLRLGEEAKKRKWDFGQEKLNIDIINDWEKHAIGLGDAIIWRSSQLNITDEKNTLLNLLKNKVVLNQILINKPYLANKLFQQKLIDKYFAKYAIETFVAKNHEGIKNLIRKKILCYPFIGKPKIGAKGVGIIKINNEKQLKEIKVNIRNYVWQNFIKNDGDYRILVLGGVALGAIKRVAKKGSYLNNLFQGGSAQQVIDKNILNEITEIATKVVAFFELDFVGVDIIWDQKEKKYKILEINTTPQWQGFEKTTGINVSSYLLDWIENMYLRNKKSTSELIEKYFDQNCHLFSRYKLHYIIRKYLWFGDDWSKKMVSKYKNEYLGKNDLEIRNRLVNMLKIDEGKKKEVKDSFRSKIRSAYRKKAANIELIDLVLFNNLFAKTVYKKDLREIIKKIISDKELFILKEKLIKDKKMMAELSTWAINYLYLLRFYLGESVSFYSPKEMLDIAKTQFSEEEKYLELKIYFLTHVIIGETNFYSKSVNQEVREDIVEILKYIEQLILNNYHAISLDCKLEFLVCNRLVHRTSLIEQLIFSEADNSMCDNGNFIVDKFNDKKNRKKNTAIKAEHRNVLYLLAKKKYRH